MNILEELWNGTICPIATQDYRSTDYREFVQLFERNEERLLPTLNGCQTDTLQKMQALMEEMRNIAECGAFLSGFRLGVQLMVASVSD